MLKSYKLIICSIVLIMACAIVTAQTKQTLTYKTVGDVSLQMDIYTPTTVTSTDTAPTIIFFFGGGWETGNRTQFKYYAELYATKGIITVLADYRIKSIHNTTPIESLKDAKSAIRYLKLHAETLHIDTTKLIAAGGSAGGQLAAASFTNETVNEDTDDLTVSAKSKFLILFNPVVDNSINGYGYEAMGDLWEEISPLHNVKAPFAPTLYMVGSNDKLAPASMAQVFKQKIEEVGGRCDLIIYPGWNHGFFNPEENRPQVVQDVDAFLISIGCLAEDDRISQTITFPLMPVKYLNDDDFDPGAVASSGLPITYTSSDEQVATIVNGKIHVVGQGSAVIKAQQSGNEEYSPAPAVSRVLVVSSSDVTDEYWINVNFTKDSTLWKSELPPLAINGVNYQSSLNGTYLGYAATGAFGKFAVSGYSYTPFNADDLNEQFIYAFRLSTGASSLWTFPMIPNAGTIRMHVLCGNPAASGEFTLQKNISGEESGWEDFDPVIKFTAPAHASSTKSFVLEKELNLNEAIQLRLKGPATKNVHIYAITISKNNLSNISVSEVDKLKLNITGRRFSIVSDTGYNATIFNMSGLHMGNLKQGEQFMFSHAGHYLVQIKMTDKVIVRKIAII